MHSKNSGEAGGINLPFNPIAANHSQTLTWQRSTRPWGTHSGSGSMSAVGRVSFAVMSCPGFMP
jgi:hypothetical protein